MVPPLMADVDRVLVPEAPGGSCRVLTNASLQGHQGGGFETVKGIYTTGDLEGRAWCVEIAARSRLVLGADVSEHVR